MTVARDEIAPAGVDARLPRLSTLQEGSPKYIGSAQLGAVARRKYLVAEPLLIFVAGPYTNPSAPERERNVSIVHEVTKQLMRKGHIVLECHSLEHAFSDDDELTHADFLRQTLSWLSRCDAI